MPCTDATIVTMNKINISACAQNADKEQEKRWKHPKTDILAQTDR